MGKNYIRSQKIFQELLKHEEEKDMMRDYIFKLEHHIGETEQLKQKIHELDTLDSHAVPSSR